METADTVTQVATAGPTWVTFAYHVFDKAWPVLGAALGGLLAGWLGLNRPAWANRKAPR